MKTVLTLIRHGETDWNYTGQWQGHSDVPINEKGRLQASQLAQHFVEQAVHFDHCYSSDLCRSLETAQIIASHLNIHVTPISELREIDMGCWSGLTRAQIAQGYPDVWQRLATGEDVNRGGAECFNDLQQRTACIMKQLIDENHNKRLCIVTHGGVIKAALLTVHSGGWEQRSLIPPIKNTSITVITATNDNWTIDCVNDASHLQRVVEPS